MIPSYPVRTDVKMVYSNNRLFYTAAESNKICISTHEGGTQWSKEILSNASNLARSASSGSTDIIIMDNWIPEEGTDGYFLSPHIFYINSNNKISCLIFDYDYVCHNWTNKDNYCDSCRENGSGAFYKKWYNTSLFDSIVYNGTPILNKTRLTLF
ncbi:MAG: hypothetical protein M0Q38_04790 [Bacteroidales bacterium]|jgi:hypothetical protein|nr:hypothetical protein [Bacteroidales bacterium]